MARRRPKLGCWIGGLLILIVPLIVLCDAITFSWIAERFLSVSVWRVGTSLRGSLTGHIAPGTVYFCVVTTVTFVIASLLAWRAAMFAAERIDRWQRALVIMSSLALLSTITVLVSGKELGRMADESPRHPLCVFRLVDLNRSGHADERPSQPVPEWTTRDPLVAKGQPLGGGVAKSMQSQIDSRRQKHLALSVTTSQDAHPDVAIVIIESFRPELVDPDVMPNLWKLVERGIHCRQHYSTGNATTHGFFGLLSGMEAIWYSELKSAPLLNRLFRSADYEIGFFAGHDDWHKFYMQDFLSAQHFDVFEISARNWLESDRRATQLAVNFLNRTGESQAGRRPRLAILYLYSTHADYHSYVKDRVFQPAADDRFVIPFSKDAVPAIWNRYKNSARSIDRFIGAVSDEDRVVLVTGDHGEAFLEDGVCGHGVRISRYQNMTPAVLYTPGEFRKSILEPTFHADLLPTLLTATGLRISDSDVLDGIDLMTRPHDKLEARLFVTRNYLTDDCGLVGLPLGDAFAIRSAISLEEWRAESLGAMNEKGDPLKSDVDGQRLLNQWAEQRFPGIAETSR